MAELINILNLEVAWSIMTKRPQAVSSLLDIYLKPTSGFVKPQFLPQAFPLIDSTADEIMLELIELSVESRVTTRLVKPKKIPNNEVILPPLKESAPMNLDSLLTTWEENNFDCATGFPDKSWEGNKIFILGDPGYGKTNTAFIWFLRCMKKYGQNAYQGFLPIIVAAKHLNIDDNTGLQDAIKFEICRLINLSSSQDNALKNNLNAILDEAVRDKRLFLVLDGLDEVAKNNQVDLNKAIIGWIGPILLTSRMNNFESFTCFTATPRWILLQMESAYTFLEKWDKYHSTITLRNNLIKNHQLRQTLRVPLLAVIACQLFDKTKLDFPNATILLMALVKNLLKTYYDDGVDTNELVTLLANVAAKTYTGDRWSITREQFIEIGKDKANALNVNIKDFFKFLTKSGNLLTKTDEYKEEFEILHQSIIAVLVAKGLLNEIRNKKTPLLQNQESIYLAKILAFNMQKGGTCFEIYIYLDILINENTKA